MHVGVVLPQIGGDWPQVREAALHAEEIGADSVWVVDHVLGFPPHRGILEAWTIMSALAATTRHVEIGAQVLCQSFRNPALLAKMAATLDRVSDGRLRLLLGAGWYQQEYEAFGWDFPSPGTLIEQLRETIHILRGMLSSEELFSFSGRHYRVRDAINVPGPARVPAIEVGGGGDRLLRTVARLADGWNCPGILLSSLDDRLEVLARACADAGRDIADLKLTCQIVCAIGDDEAAADPRYAMFSPQAGFVGSVDDATRRAEELMAKGISGFHCMVPGGERGRACLERLVRDVRPRLT